MEVTLNVFARPSLRFRERGGPEMRKCPAVQTNHSVIWSYVIVSGVRGQDGLRSPYFDSLAFLQRSSKRTSNRQAKQFQPGD